MATTFTPRHVGAMAAPPGPGTGTGSSRGGGATNGGGKEVAARVGELANGVLRETSNAEWTERVKALQELANAATATTTTTAATFRVALPHVTKQLSDPRSLVVEAACALVGAWARAMGRDPAFDVFADAFLRALLPLTQSAVGVLADSANQALGEIAAHTRFPLVVDRLVQALASSKAAPVRLACSRVLTLVMRAWEPERLAKLLPSVELALRKALRDADSRVRAQARAWFWALGESAPGVARAIAADASPDELVLLDAAKPKGCTFSRSPPAKKPSQSPPTSLSVGRAVQHPQRVTASTKSTATTPGTSMASKLRPALRPLATNLLAPPPSITATVTTTTTATMKKETDAKAAKGLSWALLHALDMDPAKRAAAMREMCAVFVAMADMNAPRVPVGKAEALVSRLTACSDETQTPEVAVAAFDAFSALVVCVAGSAWEEDESLLKAALDALFPRALVCAADMESDSDPVAPSVKDAATRALDACVEALSFARVFSAGLRQSTKLCRTRNDRVALYRVLAGMVATEQDVEDAGRIALDWSDADLREALRGGGVVMDDVTVTLPLPLMMRAAPVAVEEATSTTTVEEPPPAPLRSLVESTAAEESVDATLDNRVAALAARMSDPDPDTRKRAVDEMVRLKREMDGGAHAALLASCMDEHLDLAQLKLVALYASKSTTASPSTTSSSFAVGATPAMRVLAPATTSKAYAPPSSVKRVAFR